MSLQSYKGKGKDAGKTFYRMQPYLTDGRRVTIRLGSGQKQAIKSYKAIRDLIDSQKANCEPTAETKGWIENTVEKSLCSTLINCDLIDELPARLSGEQDAKQVTISQIADEYITTRGAGQAAGSITLYHKTKRNLVDCFGDIDIRDMKKSMVESSGDGYGRKGIAKLRKAKSKAWEKTQRNSGYDLPEHSLSWRLKMKPSAKTPSKPED